MKLVYLVETIHASDQGIDLHVLGLVGLRSLSSQRPPLRFASLLLCSNMMPSDTLQYMCTPLIAFMAEEAL